MHSGDARRKLDGDGVMVCRGAVLIATSEKGARKHFDRFRRVVPVAVSKVSHNITVRQPRHAGGAQRRDCSETSLLATLKRAVPIATDDRRVRDARPMVTMR